MSLDVNTYPCEHFWSVSLHSTDQDLTEGLETERSSFTISQLLLEGATTTSSKNSAIRGEIKYVEAKASKKQHIGIKANSESEETIKQGRKKAQQKKNSDTQHFTNILFANPNEKKQKIFHFCFR